MQSGLQQNNATYPIAIWPVFLFWILRIPSSAGRPSGGPQILAGSGVAGFVAQLVSPAGAAGQRTLAIAQHDICIFIDLGAVRKSYIL